jgi:hypothetical protein
LALPSGNPDLIAFLQALPERRQRRGVRHPLWLLLLMAILGTLSDCCHTRDLERFAQQHHHAFGEALNLERPKAACDSTFLYLFERVDLKQLFGLFREWMLAQLDGAEGATRFVSQVTLYARELKGGGLLPRKSLEAAPSPPWTPVNRTGAQPEIPALQAGT